MTTKADIEFQWNQRSYTGWIEREYQNSYLINVLEPQDPEIEEKYANRMIISKKHCTKPTE